MDAALAFLNGAGTKRPRSRRAAQKLLTLINVLCGTQPTRHAVVIPALAAKGTHRSTKPRA